MPARLPSLALTRVRDPAPLLPTQMWLPSKVRASGELNMKLASCFFNLALTSTGTVLGWGGNDTGQLGISDGISRLAPAHVRIPRNVKITVISAGPEGGGAITADGQVWVWAGTAPDCRDAAPVPGRHGNRHRGRG